MIPTYREKTEYFTKAIEPKLEEAFKRGDRKYHGMQHNDHHRLYDRRPTEDIRHIRELHVDVRLREAEDSADGGDVKEAMSKVESAIGYLTILHYRLNHQLKE
jgi:hypothetical protein